MRSEFDRERVERANLARRHRAVGFAGRRIYSRLFAQVGENGIALPVGHWTQQAPQSAICLLPQGPRLRARLPVRIAIPVRPECDFVSVSHQACHRRTANDPLQIVPPELPSAFDKVDGKENGCMQAHALEQWRSNRCCACIAIVEGDGCSVLWQASVAVHSREFGQWQNGAMAGQPVKLLFEARRMHCKTPRIEAFVRDAVVHEDCGTGVGRQPPQNTRRIAEQASDQATRTFRTALMPLRTTLRMRELPWLASARLAASRTAKWCVPGYPSR
jgi:hypothetical protein